MNITVLTEVTEETNRELRRISAATGKKLKWLYKEAIEEYAEKHKVVSS